MADLHCKEDHFLDSSDGQSEDGPRGPSKPKRRRATPSKNKRSAAHNNTDSEVSTFAIRSEQDRLACIDTGGSEKAPPAVKDDKRELSPVKSDVAHHTVAFVGLSSPSKMASPFVRQPSGLQKATSVESSPPMRTVPIAVGMPSECASGEIL